VSREADRIDKYLRDKLNLLEDEGFRVSEDVRFDGKTFRAVATRSRSRGIGGTEELILVFASFKRLTVEKLDAFTADAYDYAKGVRKSSPPLGLLWAYAVALAEEASDKVIDVVREDQPRTQGFGYVSFPVVYDAGSRDVFFYDRGSGPVPGRGMALVADVVKRYLLPD
jgi:hypothetical protein